MGVVVRSYIDFLIILLIPTPLVLDPFLQQHPYYFLNVFFVLVYVIFVQYSKRCSMNIQDRSRIEVTSLTWTWRYNLIDKNMHVSQLRVLRLPRAKYRVTFHESCS